MAEDPDGLLGVDDHIFSGDDELLPEEDMGNNASVNADVSNDVVGSRPSSRGVVTLRLVVLVVVAALGGFLFGYDTGVIGGALFFLKQERAANGQVPLSPFMEGLIPAATPFGSVFGALGSGFFADGYGRKPTVMLACVVFTLGAGVMAFSPDLWTLVVGRLVVGLGVGLVSMVGPMFLAESSPEAYRGAIVSINTLFVTGGQFVAYVVNLLLADAQYQWRWMLGVSAVPAIAQFVGMLFLTETPRWLVSQGMIMEAKRALITIRGDAAVAARDVREICIAVKSEPRGTLKELFLDVVNRRSLAIACVVLVLQQFCAINTVMYYVPFILKRSGISDTSIPQWSLLPSGMNAIGTILGIILVDRLGRRVLLIGSAVAVVFSLLILGLVYMYAENYTIIALVLYLLSFSPGLGPVPWTLNSELFAVKVRGMGMSIGTAANWFANFLISVTFPYFTDSLGLGVTMFGYMVFGIITVFFVWKFVPETKGKSLEEITAMLKERKKDGKC